MKSNLKMILSAVAVAALLASPAMAKSHSRYQLPSDAYNQATDWQACFDLSVERGSGPGKGGSTKEEAMHNSFMADCMKGKIPLR